MEKVEREQLKKENIAEDMIKAEKRMRSVYWEWRLIYIAPFLALSIIFGILTDFAGITAVLWVLSGVCALLVLYHVVQLIKQLSHSGKIINSVKSGDFTVSLEKLTNIADETVYEPHYTGLATRRRVATTKEVTFFWFSPLKWRVLHPATHYEWSKQYYLSTQGLLNTSVIGNEFYVVTRNFDNQIGYVYNTKFFIWKDLK